MGGMLFFSIPPISLKMRSADEVVLVQTVYRAYLYTFKTSGANGIIDCSKIVYYLYCAVRAGFFAFHTSNTAVGADFAGYSSLVVI